MIAMPWSPMLPLSRTVSPGAGGDLPIATPSGTMPMPEVVM